MHKVNLAKMILSQPCLLDRVKATDLVTTYLFKEYDSEEETTEEPAEPPKTIEDIYTVYETTGIVLISGYLLNNCAPDDGCEDYTDLSMVKTVLESFRNNATVKTIWLYMNSPGGNITGIQDLADTISAIDKEKPVYVYVSNGYCLSAAYWLASQARAIYSDANSQFGSIGNYKLVVDRTAQLKQEGIEIKVFSKGEGKLAGSPFLKLTKEDEEYLQTAVDKAYEQFTSAVLSKRPNIDLNDVQARVWDTEDSIAKGLSDGIYPTFREAIDYLAINL